MSNSFKHNVIVASLAAVFAAGTMSSVFANQLADTTQATSGTVTLPVQSSATSAAVTPLLNGVSFTLTEVTAGAFTKTSFATYALGNSTSLLSNSYIGLQLTGGQAVNFSYLPAGALTITADNSIGIAGATVAISSVSVAAAGSNVTIVFNGDTWNFSAPTAGSLTVLKNNVSVASGVAVGSSAGVVNVIAAQFNAAYGAGTAALDTVATSTGVSAQLNLISSRASLAAGVANTAATTFTATVTSDSAGAAVTLSSAAITAGNLPAPVVSGDVTSATAAFTTAITPATVGGSYLAIPILKNNATTPAKIVLSNIYVNTGLVSTASSTTADKNVNIVVAPGSTTAGVSKGTSTTLATVAALNSALTFGSPVSIAPGGTVTIPTITLQENLPGSLGAAANVVFNLPTGYTWGTTNAVVSVTSTGGTTTTIASLTPSTNTLTLLTTAASTGTPSKITITGLTATAPTTASTGATANVTVTTSAGTPSLSATTLATSTPFLNVQGGSVSTALNGTVANVYTFRNYASGKNGGALAAKVNLVETLSGTLLINTALNLNLVNAVSGSTTSGVTTVGSGPTFGNITGGGGSVITTGTAIGTPGYSAAGAVFSPSSFSYNISTASTTLLTNTITLGSLTIGPAVGPVTVGLTSNTLGTLPTITVANATNASNTSTTGAIPTATLNGAAVTLPTITLTESAAGALQTEVGGIGQVSFTLTNGTWDVAASQTATWCGAALPASNITGSSSSTLTVNLASVSTAACALVLNGKATAALTAAPGAAISVKVNATLSDTGQATRQELQVATVSGANTINPAVFPATQTVVTAATPSGLVFTPTFTSGSADQTKKADIYVIAYYQGVFLYKKKTPAGCAGWTGFSPQTGGIPQAYETGVTLGATYTFGNINDCDVTALKGVSYYVGYGVGSSIFGNAQTWNAMLANATFSNNAVFLTN